MTDPRSRPAPEHWPVLARWSRHVPSTEMSRIDHGPGYTVRARRYQAQTQRRAMRHTRTAAARATKSVGGANARGRRAGPSGLAAREAERRAPAGPGASR